MDNKTGKNVNRPLVASAVILVGTGLVAAGQPAQATTPIEAIPGTVAVRAPAQQLVRTSAQTPLIVYRSGVVARSASISAAPKVSPTAKKKKKVKKKYRSRRS